jgi:hypothetical protein
MEAKPTDLDDVLLRLLFTKCRICCGTVFLLDNTMD